MIRYDAVATVSREALVYGDSHIQSNAGRKVRIIALMDTVPAPYATARALVRDRDGLIIQMPTSLLILEEREVEL